MQIKGFLYPHFENRTTEHRFILENNLMAARQARSGFFFGAMGYAMMGAIVSVLLPEYFARSWRFLYFFIFPTHALAAILIPRFGRFFYLQWLLVFSNVFSSLCTLYLIHLFDDAEYYHYAYGLLICILIYAFAMLRLRTFFSLFASVMIFAEFLVYALYIRPMPQSPLVFSLAFMGFVNLGGFVSVFYFERNARTEFWQSRMIEEQSQLLAQEKKKSEALLLNVLPESVAKRLLTGERTIADYFDSVSVLFADIVGFTSLSRRLAPDKLVQMLNEIFSRFDNLASVLGLEKIKTIGDAYMVAAGLPHQSDDHAARCFEMAEGMLRVLDDANQSLEEPLRLRIGIATGPVVAGVIGQNKFIYDLWGDTVNTASRMESSGLPNEIHVTETTRSHLDSSLHFIDRGEIEIKGIGKMRTYITLFHEEKKNPA